MNSIVLRSILVLLLSVAALRADVQEMQRFPIEPRQPTWTFTDVRGQFAQRSLAATGSGDLLSFSARRSGTWLLSRVRNWAGKQPSIDHLELPGYFSSHDLRDLEQLQVKIYLVRDGAYAVCIGTAEWLRRVNGKAVGNPRMNSVIVVVDLATFTSIGKVETAPLQLLDFQSVRIDNEQRILVTSSELGKVWHSKFVLLDTPSLAVAGTCVYDSVKRSGSGEDRIPVTPQACNQALGSTNLDDYLSSYSRVAKHVRGFLCRDTKAEYCPQPDMFTPDARFALGIRNEGHDTILGSWAQTRSTAILFSNITHKQIGEVDLTHQSPSVLITTVRESDYLVLVNGVDVTVYALIDSEAAKP